MIIRERGPKPGEPNVSIALLSDLHITTSESKAYDQAKTAFGKAMSQDRGLVVVSGDVVDDAKESSMRVAAALVRETLAGARVLAVPGNHDVANAPTGGLNVMGDTPSGIENRRTLSTLSSECAQATPLGPGPWPLRVDLADGRCVVYGLDSTAGDDSWAKGRLGDTQLRLLDSDLSTLDRTQRRVVVLHHHVLSLPLGRRARELFEPECFMHLADNKKLLELLDKHNVDLVLHGHRHQYWRKTRIGSPTKFVACSSTTEGDAITGQRFFLEVKLGLESGNISVQRVHHSGSAISRSLSCVFNNNEAMSAWIELAERAYASEDTFLAFATEFQKGATRMAFLDSLATSLDEETLTLLAPPEQRPTSPVATFLNAIKQGQHLFDGEDSE